MAKVVELLDSSTGSVTTFSMAAKPSMPAVLSRRQGPKSRKRKKRVRTRVSDPNAPRRPTKFVGLWTGRGEDSKR